MSEISVTKLGPVVQVRIGEDGRPICPHCFEPMTAVDGDRWQCPEYAEFWKDMAAFVERTYERVAGLFGAETEDL